MNQAQAHDQPKKWRIKEDLIYYKRKQEEI